MLVKVEKNYGMKTKVIKTSRNNKFLNNSKLSKTGRSGTTELLR